MFGNWQDAVSPEDGTVLWDVVLYLCRMSVMTSNYVGCMSSPWLLAISLTSPLRQHSFFKIQQKNAMITLQNISYEENKKIRVKNYLHELQEEWDLLGKALTKTNQLLPIEWFIILFSKKQDTNPSSARLAKQCTLACTDKNCSHRVQLTTTTPKLQGNGKKYSVFQKNAGKLLSLGPWHNLGQIYSWAESSEVCYLRSSALDIWVINKNIHSYMRTFYRNYINTHVPEHKLIIELRRIRKKFLTGRLFHKSIL